MPRLCLFECRPTASTLHGFPNYKKFPDRFKQWVSLVGGKLETPQDYEYYKLQKVCDKHFTDKDRNRCNRLSAVAVPSLYLNGYFPSEKAAKIAAKLHRHCQPQLDVQDQTKPTTSDQSKKVNPLECSDHTYNRDESKIDVADYVKRREDYFAKVGSKSSNPTRVDPLNKSGTVSAESHEEKNEDAEGVCVTPSLPDDDAPEGDTDMTEVQFSWQHSEQISVDDDADYIDEAPLLALDIETHNCTKDKIRISKEDETIKTKDGVADNSNIESKKSEYWCDGCSKEIIDFRYTCVQCENFDLCSACEMRMLHPRHYMLRVPPRKPFTEVKSVLEAIKEKLHLMATEAKENSILLDLDVEEIKLEEPEFVDAADPIEDVPPRAPALQAPLADTTRTIENKDPPHTTDGDKRELHVVPNVFRQDDGSVVAMERKQKPILSGVKAQYFRKRKATCNVQDNENTRKKHGESPVADNNRTPLKPNVFEEDGEHSEISERTSASDEEEHREETQETQGKGGEETQTEAEDYLDEIWLDDSIMESESDIIDTDLQSETSFTNRKFEEITQSEVTSKCEKPASNAVRTRRVLKLVKVGEPLQRKPNLARRFYYGKRK